MQHSDLSEIAGVVVFARIITRIIDLAIVIATIQLLNGGNNNRQIDNGSDYPCKDDHTRFLRKIAMLHPDLLAHHQTDSLVSWLSPSTHNACCQTLGQPQRMPSSSLYPSSLFPWPSPQSNV